MGTDSYRAKTAYDEAEAAAYDDNRFRSIRGRLVDGLEKRALVRALELVPGNPHILDLACGTGRITQLLLEKGYQTSGADISEAMIQVAAGRLKRFSNLCGLYVANAERMPFPSQTFDGIVCVRLMGHVPPVVRLHMLTEMKRVTKDWIIVAYYISDAATDFKRAIKHSLGKCPQMWFPISGQGLELEIRRAGLRIVRKIALCQYVSEACMVLVSNHPP